MDNFNLNYEELMEIHKMILWNRMIDPKNRKFLDQINNKIIGQMERIQRFYEEDIVDNKYRKKIVK